MSIIIYLKNKAKYGLFSNQCPPYGHVDNSSHYKKAKKHYEKGQYAKAEKQLIYVLKNKVKFADDDTLCTIHSYLGATYLAQGKYSEALVEYSKCLEHSKDDPQKTATSHSLMAAAYSHMGNYKKSMEHALEALKSAPNDGFNRFNLACAYAQLGDHKKAIKEYKKAKKSSGIQGDIDSEIANGIAWSNFKLGNYDEALACCDQALACSESNAKLYDTKARILNAKNSPAEALSLVNKAIEIDGANPFYYATKASTLMKMAKIKEAIGALEKAHSLIKGAAIYGGLDEADREEMQSISADTILNLKHALSKGKNISDLAKIAEEFGQGSVEEPEIYELLNTCSRIVANYSQNLDQYLDNASQAVRDYVFGFCITLSQTYHVSESVASGMFVLNLGMGTKIVSGLVSLIPAYGSTLKGIVESGAGAVTKIKETQKATNFVQIARPGELERLSDDVSLKLLANTDKRKWIEDESRAVKEEVSGWWSRFTEACMQVGQDIKDSVYGSIYDTTAKKKGHHDACKVVKYWLEAYEPKTHFSDKAAMLSDHILGDVSIADGDTYIS